MTDVRPTIGERLEARIVDRRWGGPLAEDLRVLAVVFGGSSVGPSTAQADRS